ncbi:hypothetical protein [Methylocystis parvus]|uniref:Rap1a immunity protein domain-containing protein n=1 Tax=Methylocystis parvus TaxID=134 RepID=A0A6B8M7V2_9HYPH|nr:hypothetical protein [Methylocystis parvus]QGN00175.1 hypothetical protein F7D14_21675 [Methylocystis parvus]WBK02516.1 hypothetical protein MMG94_20960 [Methylocystis parvus OBBP]
MITAAAASMLAGQAEAANDFAAKTVMEKMQASERYPYIAGVVEGLTYSRFARDGKKTEGMGCIYGWFYDKPETLDLIYAAFGQYPQYTAGAIISALAKKKACGD